MKHKLYLVISCLVLALIIGLLPKRAQADDGAADREKPIRLYATAFVGPIGKVTENGLSRAGFAINGARQYGEQFIWAGDLLQAPADASLAVSLDLIGAVTLARGASVRLSTARTMLDNDKPGRALVASLINGNVDVRLEFGACAYIRACGSAYLSSEGASFSLAAKDGAAVVNARVGAVRVEQQTMQHQYSLHPVGHGTDISVRGGGLTYIRLQVIEDDRPVPGVPVLFALDPAVGKRLGTLGLGTMAGTTFLATTNADGIAAVPFTANHVKGTISISATVEGTRTSWTGQIKVTNESNASRNALIGLLISAGVGAGVAAALLSRDKDNITVLPPVVK